MSDNSRLVKNTVLLYIRMLLVMAISLYTSRIVLQNLGITDYGLYEVVGSVATMFIFLNTAMNSSTQRYLTIAIAKRDDALLRKIFNVSVVIHTIIGIIIIIICEVFGLWFISNKMAIPEGRELAVFWSFQLSMVATFVTIISVPYNALLIARERMDAFAYISIIDVLFKLFIAFVISVVNFDRLIFYALLLAVSQVIVRLMYTFYCNRKFAECKFNFYSFDSLYKEMTVFASWGLLGHVAFIINTAVQNMLLNVFFTPVVNAARGIAIRVSGAITGFSENFQTAVSPQITKSWATDNRERTYALIYNSTRFSLYLLWILSLPVFVCMDEILSIWLVEVPDYSNVFLRLILVYNLIDAGANPLNMAIRANGKIKYPEVLSGLILIMNFPLSYVALKLGSGPEAVFYILIICRIMCLSVRLFYTNKYLGMPISEYLKRVVLVPVSVLFLSLVIPFICSHYFAFTNVIVRLLVLSILCVISSSIFIYTIGVNKSEKLYIKNILKEKIFHK